MGIVTLEISAQQSITFDLDAKLANQLLAVMRQEQAALIHADVDIIEGLLIAKSNLLQQMNIAALKRYEALAANGFEGGETGMIAWLKLQADPSLNRVWNAFKKTLIEAKEINRLNGLLINRQFNLNQQMLQHLKGQHAGADTYGKSGRSHVQSTLRTALLV